MMASVTKKELCPTCSRVLKGSVNLHLIHRKRNFKENKIKG